MLHESKACGTNKQLGQGEVWHFMQEGYAGDLLVAESPWCLLSIFKLMKRKLIE
jgi:hypothetical protein